MATTTRGIETPDLGTAYNPPVDLAHMADTIEAMAQKAANYGVGTTSERTAALADFSDGAKWYDTTLSAEYRRVAGAWVVVPAADTYNYRWANAAARAAQTGMAAGDKGFQTDTAVEYKYVGTTWVPVGAYVEFRIATPQSITTATETTLDLDASPTVIRGTFAESAGVVTMPHAGMVIVTAQAIIGAGGSPTLYQWRVFKNGTTNNVLSVYQAPAVSRVLNGTGMVRVAAGDTLQVRGYQDSGATKTFGEINAYSPILILQYVA